MIDQAQVDELKKDFLESLKDIPGIVHVSFGPKEKGTEIIGEPCLRVYVEKKVDKASINPEHRIPDTFKGFKTDVIEIPIDNPAEDSDKYRPLMGGIQIGNSKGLHIGTLGYIAKRRADNNIVALSNHHVMCSDGATNGEKIGQPSVSCCGCCACNVIAEIVDNKDDPEMGVDCAIARLDPGSPFTNEIKDLNVNGHNTITGVYNVSQPETTPGNYKVYKVGRTTGKTTGIITDSDAIARVKKNGTIIQYKHQLRIRHIDGTDKRFCKGGDSGSVLINDNNQIIGLLMSGTGDDDPAPFFTHGNRIENVITAMQIDFLTSGTTLSLPLSANDIDVANDKNIGSLWQLEKEFTSTILGEEILKLIYQFQPEVMGLINNNREVKVAWNRYQGPAFIANLTKNFREHNSTIPKIINGISLQNLLIHMAVALETHGSKNLVAYVKKHTMVVLDLMQKNNTIREVLNDIKTREATMNTKAIVYN